MHLAVGQKSHQVKRFASLLYAIHHRQQDWIAEKVSGRNVVVHARNIHSNDTSGSDIQVADFRVTHNIGG
jgi:hypothetical protein